jgi:pectate lyase
VRSPTLTFRPAAELTRISKAVPQSIFQLALFTGFAAVAGCRLAGGESDPIDAGFGGTTDMAAGAGGDGQTGGTAGGGDGGEPGAGGVTGTGGNAGGAGEDAGASCMTPPPASALVGWAAAHALNPSGTTGAGDATPVDVASTADFNNNAGGTTARVLYVTGALTGQFYVGSNKTIIGLCGASLHGHLEMNGSVNVIVRNLTIVGFGAGDCALDPTYDPRIGCSSGLDAVSVYGGAQRIWFDHCDISDGTDGNLDITTGANFVTVSWTKFHYTPRTDNIGSDSSGSTGHRFSNLVGGTDNSPVDVNALNVTWHHDWWADNVSERQPRVRYGKNHLFNNLYSATGDSYCVRAGMAAGLLLENNVFVGVASPFVFNSAADQATAFITANDNLYLTVSGTMSAGGGGTPFTAPPYAYTLDGLDGLQDAIQTGAGPQ